MSDDNEILKLAIYYDENRKRIEKNGGSYPCNVGDLDSLSLAVITLSKKLDAHKEIIDELMVALDSIASVHLTEETLGALSVETQQDTLLARESLTKAREKLEKLK